MKITALAIILLALITAVLAEEDVCPQLPNDSNLTWSVSGVEDFVVCLAKAKNDERTVFGVYLGNHPQFKPSQSFLIGSGEVGNKQITWYRANAGTDTYGQEGIIKLGSTGWAQVAHVWFSAKNPEEEQQTLSLLKRIRFRANAL